MRASSAGAVVAALALAVGCVACTGSDASRSAVVTAGDQPGGEGATAGYEPEDAAGARAAVERVARLASQIDYAAAHDDLTEYLRNVRWSGGGTARPISARVVLGEVLDMQPGRAFADLRESERREGDDDNRPVPFDDPAATWRTVHLTVKVVDQLGASEDTSERVRIGVAVDPRLDLSLLRAGLTGSRSWVFFLYEGSAVFAYDKGLYAIPRNGQVFAEVLEDGALELPGFAGSEEKHWLRHARTLDELRAAAQRPTTTRRIPAA